MADYILWRKIARIIMQLADTLEVSPERALRIFYASTVGEQMHDKKYGYQIMSDTYVVNDIIAELRNR